MIFLFSLNEVEEMSIEVKLLNEVKEKAYTLIVRYTVRNIRDKIDFERWVVEDPEWEMEYEDIDFSEIDIVIECVWRTVLYDSCAFYAMCEFAKTLSNFRVILKKRDAILQNCENDSTK